jgi:radical SAM superfamily enzyme YgiQ (UPF0313 family)
VTDIVLAALNARYSHASLGLRCLLANLGPLRGRAAILEFDIKRPAADCAAAILARRPRIAALGAYIWNLRPLAELVALVKGQTPDVAVVLGGPEASFPAELPEVCRLADYTIGGEADIAFGDLCGRLLAGDAPPRGFIAADPPDLERLSLPYDEYGPEDLAHRTLYVEASRGCAFACEFCLSSLDAAVRRFPLETLLPAFERLLARGARAFKFVDRTFNISPAVSEAILRFFLDRRVPGLFLHFEMVPDRLPAGLRDLLVAFPAGSLQLEVGIQTFNEDVARRIRRRQDYARTEENLRWLLANTGAHLHADLIAGLPGETPESFAAGFDRLAAIGPHEIQVGILKKLRGTPIGRHDAEWGMVYSPDPPYALLRSRLMDGDAIGRLRHFARCWDLVINSGRFAETGPLLWSGGGSVFDRFMDFSNGLHRRFGRSHGIALEDLARAVFDHLAAAHPDTQGALAAALARDYVRATGRRPPPFLAGAGAGPTGPIVPLPRPRAFRRQAIRHA